MIRKMTAAIMDPELDELATFYTVPDDEVGLAQQVIEKFNALKIVEERARPGPHTPSAAVVGEKVKKVDGDKVTSLQIRVTAVIEGARICVDTIDPATQDKFEALADKAGLDLGVTVPPKLAAMLANFRKEEASPRGVDDEGNPSPIVKQIIFCDMLAMHNKIRRILVKHAGVSASQIAIVTGRQNNEPEQIIAVQNGFNAHGDDNKYRVIIANEKAEVGINLQRGTQAIHHLTVGWTPDSLTQRNGRGVRQGNRTAVVSVYHYDADGTFDAHKRKLVNHKAAWIDEVMDVNGRGSVEISGQISAEQQEALMDTVGDADAMLRFTESLEQKELATRRQVNRDRQTISIKSIEATRKWLKESGAQDKWAAKRLMELWSLQQAKDKLADKSYKSKSEDKAAAFDRSWDALKSKIEKLEKDLTEGIDLQALGQNGREAPTIQEMIRRATPSYQRHGPDLMDFERQFYTGKGSDKAGLVEGSTLHSDYLADIANAEDTIEAAKEQFKSYAQLEGGMPAEVVDLIAQGKGQIVNGVPMVDGAILVYKGGESVLLVDGGGSRSLRWEVRTWGGARVTDVSLSVNSDTEIFYPGTPEYARAADLAAAYEDKMVEAHPGFDGQTFADRVPEIAARRKAVALIPVESQLLPAPFFPYYIIRKTAAVTSTAAPAMKERLQILGEIHEKQQAIVKEVGGRGFVDASVQLRPWPQDGFSVTQALIDYCSAQGKKTPFSVISRLAYERNGGISGLTSKHLMIQASFVGADDFKEILQGVKSSSELPNVARGWIVSKHPAIELSPSDLEDFLGFLSREQNSAFCQRLSDLEAEEKKAAAAEKKAADDKVQADLAGGDDEGLVGITGETYPHKDMIKSMSLKIAGEAAKFVKRGQDCQWNVKRKVWKAIAKQHPDLVGTLVLTEYRK